MIYQTCSAKVVLGRMTRFQIQSTHWIGNLPVWIGEAMADMNAYSALVKTSARRNIVGYRTEIPCDLVSLYAVEENGYRLPYSGDQSHFNLWCEPRTTNMIPVDGTQITYGVLEGNTLGSVSGLNNSPLMGPALPVRDAGRSYQLNPGYIITSFEEGVVKLHYSKYPTDEDGLPMIPDIEAVKTAMMWYIFMNLLASGYEHPVFKYQDAEARYNSFREEAWDRMRGMSVDTAERLRRSMVRLIPREYQYEDFFMGSHNTERIDTRP